MAKIICLTGPNGAGKSTIADKLTQILSCKYKHFDKVATLEEGRNEYFNFLRMLQDDDFYIIDRFYECEDVYPRLYRGYKLNYLADIENEIIKNHKFMFVYVTAELQTIIDRINIRGEDYVKPEHFGDERKLFDDFFIRQHLPYINIDTTITTVDENVKQIQDTARILKII